MNNGSSVKRNSQATIYSIAQELGISASTVSRAFSRPEMVKESVREAIMDVAKRQGYQINRTARSLATGKTGLIGVAVMDITNPFMPPLVRSIDQAAKKSDLSLLLFDMKTGEDTDASALIHLSKQVDGLIVISPRSWETQLLQLAQEKPTVLINQEVAQIPSVVCDNTKALHQAASHLVDQGHEHILLMGGPTNSWAAKQRIEAVRAWGETAPSWVKLTELEPRESSFEAGRKSAKEVRETGATAVIAFDDFYACGVVAGLADLGLEVPKDFSVVGCDDVLLARTLTPQLTTVSAPFYRIGQASVKLLAQVMMGKTPESVSFDGEFIQRGTTGIAPPRG